MSTKAKEYNMTFCQNKYQNDFLNWSWICIDFPQQKYWRLCHQYFGISWPFTPHLISHLFVFNFLDFNILSLCSSWDQNHTTVPRLCLLNIDYFHCARTDGRNFLTRWKSNKVKDEEGENSCSGTGIIVKSNFKWIRADQRGKDSITVFGSWITKVMKF